MRCSLLPVVTFTTCCSLQLLPLTPPLSFSSSHLSPSSVSSPPTPPISSLPLTHSLLSTRPCILAMHRHGEPARGQKAPHPLPNGRGSPSPKEGQQVLSLQKISKSAAKGYAEYIEEQNQEVNERMAMYPSLHREDVEREVARKMVARVAKREGEDVAEALRQFDRREDLAQVGAQASYYSINPNEKIEGDRLTHIVGEHAGKEVESDELLDILMSRDGDGKQLHEPQHKALKSLLDEVGVAGVPTPEQRDALRNGVHPETGAELTGMAAAKQARAYAEGGLREDSVTGIDMTFSCPKSLSIVAAAAAASGDTETYEAILTDVRNAVSATLGRADNEGLILGRRGEDGIDKVRAHLTNGVAKIETGSRSHDP